MRAAKALSAKRRVGDGEALLFEARVVRDFLEGDLIDLATPRRLYLGELTVQRDELGRELLHLRVCGRGFQLLERERDFFLQLRFASLRLVRNLHGVGLLCIEHGVAAERERVALQIS